MFKPSKINAQHKHQTHPLPNYNIQKAISQLRTIPLQIHEIVRPHPSNIADFFFSFLLSFLCNPHTKLLFTHSESAIHPSLSGMNMCTHCISRLRCWRFHVNFFWIKFFFFLLLKGGCFGFDQSLTCVVVGWV